jgi:hypothetical protein
VIISTAQDLALSTLAPSTDRPGQGCLSAHWTPPSTILYMSSMLAAVRGPAVAAFVADQLTRSTLTKNAIADAATYFAIGERTAWRYWAVYGPST